MQLFVEEELSPDKERVHVYRIDNKRLFEFYQQTRTLKISIDSGDLEILLAQIREIPPQGKDIRLEMPEGFRGNLIFRDVRRIEQITGLEKSDYLYKMRYQSLNN